ncbi:hypothetical protein DXT91_20825 [Agrobacterium tumefaciens]|uniref:hypothetical protein n=1 Tax=Agrobacterium tumefaciens TaxID=358 RepID=UPI0012B9FD60|nr:hypothetical protein [Agrobacterium tumefaciens]MQB06540.1 hypothetical protein [Agrobacterium tumefaciens]
MTTSLQESEDANVLKEKEVAEWVYQHLKETDDPAHPVLLSKLGGRIAKEFGRPVKSLLGRGNTLSHVLSDQLEGKIGFIGNQGTLAVFIDESAVSRQDEPLPRLNKVLWAAFFRPIKSGDRRFIRLVPEVYFWDGPEDSAAPSPGWEEIEQHRIPASDLALPQRNRAAYSAIEEWFKLRGYELSDYIQKEDGGSQRSSEKAPLHRMVGPAHTTEEPQGIEALRTLIMSIPEKDRKNYSVTLDLLSALIK